MGGWGGRGMGDKLRMKRSYNDPCTGDYIIVNNILYISFCSQGTIYDIIGYKYGLLAFEIIFVSSCSKQKLIISVFPLF